MPNCPEHLVRCSWRVGVVRYVEAKRIRNPERTPRKHGNGWRGVGQIERLILSRFKKHLGRVIRIESVTESDHRSARVDPRWPVAVRHNGFRKHGVRYDDAIAGACPKPCRAPIALDNLAFGAATYFKPLTG